MSDTTPGAAGHSHKRRTRRHTRPVGKNLVVSAGLLVAFVIYSWLVVKWSPFIRLDFYLNRDFHVQSAWPELHVLDRIGQRAVCLPILGVVVGVTGWRHRSWRPILLGAVGVFTINLVVLIIKLALSRGRPLSHLSFFSDGDLYPSGHTANIIVVYGTCYHVITHYGHVSERVRRLLIGLLCLLSVVMFSTSLLLRWHWFSDLIGGFIIGGAVLALTVGIDAAVPFRSHRLVVIPARAQRPDVPSAEPVPTHRGASDDDIPSGESSRLSRHRKPDDSPAPAGDRQSRH